MMKIETVTRKAPPKNLIHLLSVLRIGAFDDRWMVAPGGDE
jgi:hypothetical protein